MTASTLPPPRTVFVDANGVPVVNGSLLTQIPNTSSLKATWADAGQTILNSNPIILDNYGSCQCLGVGTYLMTLKDSQNNTLYTGLSTSPGGTASSTYVNVVTSYGATGDGTTDDTIAIQNALNFITTTGGCLYFPTGVYRITSALTAVWTNTAYLATQRPAIIGDGSGLSVIVWDGGNTPNTYMLSISRNDSSGTQASFALSTIQGIGFAPINTGKNYYASGLYLSKLPFMTVSDITTHQLNKGINLDQILNMQFNRCVFSNGQVGIHSAGTPASPTSNLYANNCLLFLGCIVGANQQGGASFQDSSFQFINGTFEYNGAGASAGEGFGCYIANSGTASAVTAIFDGVYFEGNGGTGIPGTNPSIADIWIQHDGNWDSQSYIMRGNFFNRLSTGYAPYCIYVNVASNNQAILNITNNQFQSSAGYTPVSTNPYTFFNDGGGGLANIVLDARSNGFASATEFPDWVAATEYYNGLEYKSGALVTTNASQSLTVASDIALTFQVAVYNNYAIWASGSPTKLTVPANVSKVKVNAGFLCDPTSDTTAGFKINIWKNGVATYDCNPTATCSALNTIVTGTPDYALNVTSSILNVSPGDYFEAMIFVSGTNTQATNTTNFHATYFSMEIIA